MYNIFVIIKIKFTITKLLLFGGEGMHIGQKIRQLRKKNMLNWELMNTGLFHQENAR